MTRTNNDANTEDASDTVLLRRLSIIHDTGWIDDDDKDGDSEDLGRKGVYRGIWVMMNTGYDIRGDVVGTEGVKVIVEMREVVGVGLGDDAGDELDVEEIISLAGRLSGPENFVRGAVGVMIGMPVSIVGRFVEVDCDNGLRFLKVEVRNLMEVLWVEVFVPRIRLEDVRVVGGFETDKCLDLEEFFEFGLLSRVDGEDKKVVLRPRECFDFAFRVQSKNFGSYGWSEEGKNVIVPKLEGGCELATDIVVGWKVFAPKSEDEENESSSRMVGVGSLEGPRLFGDASKVASQVLTVQWQPTELICDVIINFYGPRMVVIDKTFDIEITVVNHGSEKLEAAMLFIDKNRQEKEGEVVVVGQELIALRSTTFLGRIDADAICTVKIPCICYVEGVVNLGSVRLVDVMAGDECERNVWRCEKSFGTFAVLDDCELLKMEKEKHGS